MISSSLNLVGLTITLAPFERVQSMVPNCGFSVAATTVPATGAVGIRGSELISSTKASMVSASTAARASAIISLVGTVIPSASGMSTMTARLSGVTASAIFRLMRSRGTLLAIPCVSAHSVSIDGNGSLSVKFLTYSLTNEPV